MLQESQSTEAEAVMRESSSESYLAQRVSRSLKQKSRQELTFEFTKDPGYLHQYYILRSRLMERALGWHLEAGEDEYDKRSHVMVVRKGKQVIGGSRIIVRSPRLGNKLLLEDEGFSLVDALPELNLADKKYCEFSRFVLLEEYQQSLIPMEMFRRIHQKYTALGISYGFASVGSASIRVHRKMCHFLGLNYTIRDDIKLPEKPHYDGVDMTLIMFDDHGLKDDRKTIYDAVLRRRQGLAFQDEVVAN